ncbi:MAG: hypothetical protein EOP68_25025, partial [Sphingomonas sp.]
MGRGRRRVDRRGRRIGRLRGAGRAHSNTLRRRLGLDASAPRRCLKPQSALDIVMTQHGKPGHVLLVAGLMQSAVDGLDAAVDMLDGRDPAVREKLVRAHADTIRGIATSGHAGASRALIEALPKLEIIACFSAGIDNVDVEAAAERGIPVTATSDALADDVADLAIAHCLLLLRRLTHADRFVRDNQW